MSLPILLSISASLMHLVAFASYNAQMKDPTFKPNTATWTLWAVLTATNCGAYFSASNDWVKSILPAASSVACIMTFAFALVRGKFERLSMADSVAFVIGLIAVFVWYRYQSATDANLILQGAVAVSFVPTYVSVGLNPNTEKPLPWALWGIAYVLLTIVVVLRWTGHWTDLVYPIQGALMHSAVVPLTWRKAHS